MLKYFFVFMTLFSACWANSPLLIGIAGGSGSGKSTLAKKIQEAFPNETVIISQDNYYKDRSHLPTKEERLNCIFDHPDAIEFSLLKEHLIALKEGKSIDYPTYDFNLVGRGGSYQVEPHEIVIVEGILIFAIPEIRELFDLKIFIDADDDIRLLRRLERDFAERSHNLAIAKDQYLNSTRPMYEQFVAPSKQFADLIVPHGGENQTALEVLLSFLHEKARITNQ